MAQISVVIPAFNSAATLGETLQSVAAQTVDDFEALVVDDGSTDSTAMTPMPDARFRLISQANRGTAGARNSGIRETSAPLVAFLDHDDILFPIYLEEMVGLAASFPEHGLFVTDAWVFDGDSGRVARKTAMQCNRPPKAKTLSSAVLLEELLARNFVYAGTTVRRLALDGAGYFNETLRGVDDWEMWIRLAMNGTASVRSDDPLALYRRHPNQLSSDKELMLRETIRVFEGVLERVPPRYAPLAQATLERATTEHVSPPGRHERRFNRLRKIPGRFRHWRIVPPKEARALLAARKTPTLPNTATEKGPDRPRFLA